MVINVEITMDTRVAQGKKRWVTRVTNKKGECNADQNQTISYPEISASDQI